MGKPVLTLVLQVHQLEKNPNIFLTVYYGAGRL